MRAVRLWTSGLTLWSVTVEADQQLWAHQSEGATVHALGDSPSSLSSRVDELDQQLQQQRHYSGQQCVRQRKADSAFSQGYFYAGPLGLLGEYVISRSEVTRAGAAAALEHTAWQAEGSFFLTGEKAGFRSPVPRKPFDLKEGGLGAVELVARKRRAHPGSGGLPSVLQHRIQRSGGQGMGRGRQLALHPCGQGGSEL